MNFQDIIISASSVSVAAFDWGVIQHAGPALLKEGLVFTLKLTIYSTVLALIWGTILAMMRLSSISALRFFAGSYVNIMRSLPLILILFWFFFLVPYILGWIDYMWALYVQGNDAARMVSRPLDGFTCALITFTLFEAAYFCEIMRAGIQSIPRGQVGAGYALGLRYFQVMRLIVLPQAFRNMLPVIFTQMIVLFQDTSLVTVLSLNDLLGMARINADITGRPVELYLFAAAIYFVISLVCSRLVKVVDRRLTIIR